VGVKYIPNTADFANPDVYTYISFNRVNLSSTESYEWCLNHDGEGAFAFGGHGVYFENEKDAIIFALKVSG